VVDSFGVDRMGNGGSGGCYIAIDNDRDFLVACSDQGAEDGRDLAAADAGESSEWMIELAGMERQGTVDGVDLVGAVCVKAA
jgi:hypothetical protein